MKPKALLSWSSGKDCAWSLHIIRQRGDIEIVGLLTTFNEAFDRVAMHGVRHELVEAQARAAGLPLIAIPLPWPCSNADYESRMSAAVARAKADGITHMVFGDLFLEDIRQYRIDKLRGTGIEPLFPIWGSRSDTLGLSKDMLAAGLKAKLACVDSKQLDARFAGRDFDSTLLEELPAGVDRCGENGEFHTFCYDGPMFSKPIPIRCGETINREGFIYTDILPG
jgi:uncharacterized protein (TIGR00290 family)